MAEKTTMQREAYYEVSGYSYCFLNGSNKQEFDAQKFVEEVSNEVFMRKFKDWKEKFDEMLSNAGCKWVQEPKPSKVVRLTITTDLS